MSTSNPAFVMQPGNASPQSVCRYIMRCCLAFSLPSYLCPAAIDWRYRAHNLHANLERS